MSETSHDIKKFGEILSYLNAAAKLLASQKFGGELAFLMRYVLFWFKEIKKTTNNYDIAASIGISPEFSDVIFGVFWMGLCYLACQSSTLLKDI